MSEVRGWDCATEAPRKSTSKANRAAARRKRRRSLSQAPFGGPCRPPDLEGNPEFSPNDGLLDFVSLTLLGAVDLGLAYYP